MQQEKSLQEKVAAMTENVAAHEEIKRTLTQIEKAEEDVVALEQEVKTLTRIRSNNYHKTNSWPNLTKKQMQQIAVPVRSTPKINRNEPCACGSGKKYKKCCMNKS